MSVGSTKQRRAMHVVGQFFNLTSIARNNAEKGAVDQARTLFLFFGGGGGKNNQNNKFSLK